MRRINPYEQMDALEAEVAGLKAEVQFWQRNYEDVLFECSEKDAQIAVLTASTIGKENR